MNDLFIDIHREQRGVLRTNCIDCLDRTNVAQVYLFPSFSFTSSLLPTVLFVVCWSAWISQNLLLLITNTFKMSLLICILFYEFIYFLGIRKQEMNFLYSIVEVRLITKSKAKEFAKKRRFSQHSNDITSICFFSYSYPL